MIALISWAVAVEEVGELINMLLSLSKKCLDLSDLSERQESLLEELSGQGFARKDAAGAVEWFMAATAPVSVLDMSVESTRVFSPDEKSSLTRDDVSVLIYMEKNGIITPAIREHVIANILSVYEQGVPPSAAIWVTYLVLSAGSELLEERQRMELMLMRKCQGGVH